MVKVGKVNLTKEQAKRTTHLPIHQAVYVPSTSGVKTQRKISKREMDERVRNVRRYLSNRFGGYTSTKNIGGFVSGGKVVREKVVRVSTYASKEDFKKHKPQVIRKVGFWGRKWKQVSVGYENEGDFYMIEPGKEKRIKRKISPTQRKIMLRNLVKARRSKR